jgi:LysM repeat protein
VKRIVAGLGALILSAALLVGIPAALIFLAGNPIPSWDELVSALTGIDFGGEFLIGTVIPLVAWAAWVTFAIGFLAEIPNQVRAAASPGRSSRRVRVPGLGMQQKAAGVLIAAMIAIVAPTAAFASTPAHAETTDVAAVAVSTPAPAPATDASSTTGTVQEAPAAAQTYTVRSGDSLWAIAEHSLGDGARWPEIYELNHDRPQPGGYTVGQRDGIDPGMVLEIPAHATAAPAAAGEHERTVERGDTLWSIAQDELGSGTRYTEIVDASRDITQPGGRHITDPNLILPGWTLDIPAEASAAPAAAAAPAAPPAAAPTPTAPVDGAAHAPADTSAGGASGASSSTTDKTAGKETSSGLGFVTGGGNATQKHNTTADEKAPTTTAASAHDDGQDWTDILSDWRTIGGVGALLAAGLLGFLGWRRRQQRRSRKPGQRIVMPTEDITAVELELRAVENPQGMEAVDHTLRLLAIWAQDTGETLPALYALRLSDDEVSIFLDEPAQLPAPFTVTTEDAMAWSINIADIPPLERIPSAPYPALVTIGHDENDAHLLVDLERLGALNVDGSPEIQSAALTALALELATSSWSENLQVTLVGIAPGLPDAIGSDRIRHVDDLPTLMRNLRGQADAVTTALADANLASLEQARTAGPFAESWTPEIVVLGQMPDEATRAELAELVSRIPRVGIAAIAAGHLAGGWNFRVQNEDSAELEIPGTESAVLPLTPQLVSAVDYDRILALFQTAADENATEHSPASAEVELDEIAAPVATAADDDDATLALADVAEPDVETVDDAEATTVATATTTSEATRDVDAPAAEPAEHPVATTTVDVDERQAQLADVDEPDLARGVAPVIDLHTPRLQMLGAVNVLHPQGAEPANEKQWNSQRLRAIELIAFIATHPGASTEQVHEALWPGNDPARGTQSRNRLTTAARRWLGQDAQGRQYLVPATKGVYELTDTFMSDWDDWQELVGSDPTTASTENLVRALSLVKGQPISGVKEKYYVWSDTLRQEMIAAVGDASHELATRALREGNTRNARMAAAIGRMVDPVNEVYWRDGLRAEHMAGDFAGVERLVTQLENALTGLDPDYAEPEPETEELIAQLRQRHALVG